MPHVWDTIHARGPTARMHAQFYHIAAQCTVSGILRQMTIGTEEGDMLRCHEQIRVCTRMFTLTFRNICNKVFIKSLLKIHRERCSPKMIRKKTIPKTIH